VKRVAERHLRVDALAKDWPSFLVGLKMFSSRADDRRRNTLGAPVQDTVVADGRERLRDEAWYRRKAREAREAVRSRYEPELATANGYERVVLYWKMWWELRRRTEELAPKRGLYLRSSEFLRR
jgi:hypothetical protein